MGTTKDGYTIYSSRFLVVLLFALNNAMNAVMWICFSPIVATMEKRFNTSTLAINMLSLVFMIGYLPGSIISVYSLERYGLRKNIILGSAISFACGWVRYGAMFIPNPAASYAVTMIGQIIGALGQPIFTNAPSRIAGDWFPSSERDLATVAASMSNPVGNALGSVIPTLIVSAVGDVPTLMLVQAIAASVLLLFTVLFVKDRPPSPPSAAAEMRKAALNQQHLQWQAEHPGAQHSVQGAVVDEAKQGLLAAGAIVVASDGAAGAAAEKDTAHAASQALQRLKEDFSSLFRNKNFLKLMTAFGIGLGMFNALLTVLAQYIAPCGYDANTAGIAGGALLGCGLVGAVIMGAVLEKTHLYMPLLKAGIVGTLGSTLFVLGSLQKGNSAQLIAAFGIMGLCLIPLLPVSLENAAECTYPIPEDNSAALLLLSGQLWGIIFIMVLTPLIGRPESANCSTIATPAAGFILSSIVLAAAVLMFFGKDYRRQAAEEAHKLQVQQGQAHSTSTTSAAAIAPATFA